MDTIHGRRVAYACRQVKQVKQVKHISIWLASACSFAEAGTESSFNAIKCMQFTFSRCSHVTIPLSLPILAQILESAAGVVGSQSDVTAQFDAAVKEGFNVVRIFAFGTEGGFALQTSLVCWKGEKDGLKAAGATAALKTSAERASFHTHASCIQWLPSTQGQYNQQAWDALDYVVNEAKQRSLRLVVALADNW